MKILLVQQGLNSIQEVGPVFPIGLSYIATSIKKNTSWDLQVLDLNLYQNPYCELEKKIIDYTPDVVALSLRNIDNVDYYNFSYYYQDLPKVIGCIKKHECILVIGGAGYSIFAETIFSRHPEVDFGILQEGEDTIVELLNHIQNGIPFDTIKGLFFRKNNKVHFGGMREPLNFSRSAIPDRDLFEMEKYSNPLCMGVQTKRGCSLKCSYCTYPFLNKHQERFRNPISVVDEIEILIMKYGVNEIIFCDDIFNAPQEHSLAIMNEIIQRGLKIRWSAWFDVGNTDVEFIRTAIQSGCYRFCFSIEAVLDNSLKILHKNFNASQAERLINICLSPEFSNIEFRFSLFALPPGQTFIGMLKTLKVVYKAHLSRSNSKCLVSWIRVFPKTELFDNLTDKKRDLLPIKLDDKTKKELFWCESNLPLALIKLYEAALVMTQNCRKWKKRYWSFLKIIQKI